MPATVAHAPAAVASSVPACRTWPRPTSGRGETSFSGLPFYQGLCTVVDVPGRLDKNGGLIWLDSSAVSNTSDKEALDKLKQRLLKVDSNQDILWHPWYNEANTSKLDSGDLKEKVSLVATWPHQMGQTHGRWRYVTPTWSFSLLSLDHKVAHESGKSNQASLTWEEPDMAEVFIKRGLRNLRTYMSDGLQHDTRAFVRGEDNSKQVLTRRVTDFVRRGFIIGDEKSGRLRAFLLPMTDRDEALEGDRGEGAAEADQP